ncbi:MAG: glycosyltransferase [Salegentibacter sp.]|uniref:glycosyltransferase n=1 Tax=Salegentibacter sp. TaxID=1903072 RepID=UPI00286FB1C3|nr:glycosyltransferase [Salegentibacter sp.]MDR9456249.1 glycosyltransferase [Salegentibacter sp.]
MKKLLIIGYVWPEPASSAAGTRMMQLIDFFLKENYQVHFSTTATRTAYAPALENLGIITKVIELNSPSFDSYIEDLQPDIVLFDRFMMEEQFSWRVDKFCPAALKILDTEDLHFIRKARHTAYKENKNPKELYLSSEIAKREIASIYRSDLSLIISEVEMQLLSGEFNIPESLLFYLPFMMKEITSEEIDTLSGFNDRKDFISIGNFLHDPNRNAVFILKEKIWPVIRKQLPQANLHIYGAYPSEKIFKLNDPKTGFLVHGRADNAEEEMKKARICLAPLQFGAGLKGKLIQAMQCGTPAVTSEVGAEGIPGDLPWNGFIENDPEKFSAAAVKLYQDESEWKTAQICGFQIINSRFSEEIFQKEFQRKLQLIDRLHEHREKNFIGAMLRHHLHRSTYFMSRFIEEKNKTAG